MILKTDKNKIVNHITIITSTLNSEKTIKRCLNSVYNFNNLSEIKVEHFIADGGSDDNTLDIIKKENKSIARIVSYKDRGIYDAWNKALKYVKDGWVLFLGSDDYLLPSIIGFIKEINIRHCSKKLNMISGITIYEKPIRKNSYLYGKELNKFLLMHSMQIANCATLYNKKLFLINKFNINYKIIGDYDFLLRNRKEINHLYLKYPISFMSADGVSSKLTSKLFLGSLKSRILSYKYNPASIFLILIFSIPSLLRLICMKIKG